jgi:threonine dehydratase
VKPDLEAMQQAQAILAPIIYQTPIAESTFINELTGRRVLFKLENLQRTGSFKIRGAYVRLASLSAEERRRGVITASAGNHAQGVALAASLLDISALVVMPERAALTKIEATRSYHAEVRLAGESFDDAEAYALALAKTTGRVFIPPFDAPEVISGQATVALEMFQQCPEIKTLVVPVGGGGLIAGMAAAAKALWGPTFRVVGVQAQGADAVVQSLAHGEPMASLEAHTIADGIQVKRPGVLTFSWIAQYVDAMVTVADYEISRAMLMFLERMKLVVEGAGAVGLAALLAGVLPAESLSPIGVVVSGGNLDVSLLSRILQKGLVEEGRQLHLSTVITDAPGHLSRLLSEVARLGANVVRIDHERWDPSLDLGQVSVRLVLETRDGGHQHEVVNALKERGYIMGEFGSFVPKISTIDRNP